MRDFAAARSEMAEYWHIRLGLEDPVKKFFSQAPEADVTLEADIPEKDFNSAGRGSAEVKNLLKRLGVDPEVLRRVAVAAYEAEINVAAHSLGGSMTSNIHPELIHMVFQDNGPGIADIEQAMIPGFSTADEMVRELGFGAGLGLPNIQKNADALHISSEKGDSTCLEIIIYFKNDGQ
ncbi:MAG: ATP-binding protein [Candidatus Syntrophosphaera sp.]|nr:ATP-binding protein [Candidatus Syntrophosphaera sp.]